MWRKVELGSSDSWKRFKTRRMVELQRGRGSSGIDME
jgi:hypothetical protein